MIKLNVEIFVAVIVLHVGALRAQACIVFFYTVIYLIKYKYKLDITNHKDDARIEEKRVPNT